VPDHTPIAHVLPGDAPGSLHLLSGRFVVFEGPDGSGKSTQLRLFSQACKDAGLRVCDVREPGGTVLGERIRQMLLDPQHHDMSTRCEMLLYMASRAQLVEHRIRPALSRGEFVLADRFVSSTLAYQGAAGGLPEGEILAAAACACGTPGTSGAVWPDLVVIFDVNEATARSRLSPLLDRMEQKSAEFHAKVRKGYLAQAQREPERHLVVDASRGPDEVYASLLAGVQAWLARGAGSSRRP